ncbi:MAG TPA: hypothetical protein PK205_07185 [Promineifilum sp.]|nr:hypothetical protein [Promineifilum sp.]
MYGTVEGYKAYHLARGNDIPASSDTDIAEGLLVASEWLDGRYRIGFGGLKVGGRDQVREWPRSGAMDIYGYAVASDSVPREVEYATYEAAAKQLAVPGSLSVDFVPSKYKRASVDGAVSVEWAGYTSAVEVQTQFAIIDQILAPLLVGNPAFPASSMFSGTAERV